MYESFYGLTSKPFQLNPDPKFYFASKQHRRATAYLEYGMHQNEGFIVVTGEVGAGKTTIVRGMLENLDQDKVVAAHLVSTQLDADDTLRLVGAAFGIRTKDVEKSDVLMSLEAFLISMTGKGKRCLLIVDEAQNLTARAVEELRMLSNFQFGNHALLQSFLIGQPEFREILQSPQMAQFRQRVIASCHIGPMDVDETRGYVEHRLKCAGADQYPVFAPDSFLAIFKATSGIPRRINSVCDRLMLFGYLNDKKEFDARDVDEVAGEIFEETQGNSTTQRQRAAGRASRSGSNLANIPSDADVQPPNTSKRRRRSAAPAKEFEVSSREDLNHLLAGLNAWQFNERLGRLEQSLQQLELINGTTLSLLQKIVSSIVPDNEAPAEDSSSIDGEIRTKAKQSKAHAHQEVSPGAVSSGELTLNESSLIGKRTIAQGTGMIPASWPANLGPVICVVGARPNFMKMAPILRAFSVNTPSIPTLLVHTGQHYDKDMNDKLFEDLRLPRPDINLDVGSATHAVQTAEVMRRFEPVIDTHKPSCVLVVGDVNSTLACTLVAVKKGIPVVHVEAGLRSYDRKMPEEINRILTDQIADRLYTTERSAEANLVREGIAAERVRFVGNVMIDSLLHNREFARTPAATVAAGGFDPALIGGPEGYGVVTLHRPSNVDHPDVLASLLGVLSEICPAAATGFCPAPKDKSQHRTVWSGPSH